jgi:hypothetical protein
METVLGYSPHMLFFLLRCPREHLHNSVITDVSLVTIMNGWTLSQARLAKSAILVAGFGGCMALLALRWATDDDTLRMFALVLAWLALVASLGNFFRSSTAIEEPPPARPSRSQRSHALSAKRGMAAATRPAFPGTFGPFVAGRLVAVRNTCAGSDLRRTGPAVTAVRRW